jgi:hypothetical protein
MASESQLSTQTKVDCLLDSVLVLPPGHPDRLRYLTVAGELLEAARAARAGFFSREQPGTRRAPARPVACSSKDGFSKIMLRLLSRATPPRARTRGRLQARSFRRTLHAYLQSASGYTSVAFERGAQKLSALRDPLDSHETRINPRSSPRTATRAVRVGATRSRPPHAASQFARARGRWRHFWRSLREEPPVGIFVLFLFVLMIYLLTPPR